jgi:intein-encoded DNA endonuclease-like protein
MECNREEAFAYLVGALGDGTLYTTSDGHYVVEYGQKDVRWLRVIEQKASCLGYRTHIVKHKSSYWKAKIYSKELYTALSETKSRLHDLVNSFNAKLFVAYLRGLFDAEGTITRPTEKP